MNVVNVTPFPVQIQRDCFRDAFAVVDATTKVTYEVDGDAPPRFAAEQLPVHIEPCAEAPFGEIRYMRDEHIVEITVIGEAVAGTSGPFRSRELRLSVGDHRRRLMAFAPRTWERHGSSLRPETTRSAERVPVTWELAYGGTIERPPGFLPGTRIPAPSTEIPWAANPAGTGFAIDEHEVEGSSLPQVEDPAALIRAWSDRPTPHCWAPMPTSSSLRMDHIVPTSDRLKSRHGDHELVLGRAQLNAPPDLQFVDIGIGTRISVEGYDPVEALRFELPQPAFFWRVRTGPREHRVAPKLGAVQIRPNERRVTCLYRTRLFAPLVAREIREAFQEPSPEFDRIQHPPGSAQV